MTESVAPAKGALHELLELDSVTDEALDAFLAELRALLRKALDALPESERRRYFRERRRPRRSGKPA